MGAESPALARRPQQNPRSRAPPSSAIPAACAKVPRFLCRLAGALRGPFCHRRHTAPQAAIRSRPQLQKHHHLAGQTHQSRSKGRLRPARSSVSLARQDGALRPLWESAVLSDNGVLRSRTPQAVRHHADLLTQAFGYSSHPRAFVRTASGDSRSVQAKRAWNRMQDRRRRGGVNCNSICAIGSRAVSPMGSRSEFCCII